MLITKFPQSFHSGNQAKYFLYTHESMKPSKNHTLLMTTRSSIWQLDYPSGGGGGGVLWKGEGGPMPPPPPDALMPLSSNTVINPVYHTARNLQCVQKLSFNKLSKPNLNNAIYDPPFSAMSNTLLHIIVVYLYIL